MSIYYNGILKTQCSFLSVRASQSTAADSQGWCSASLEHLSSANIGGEREGEITKGFETKFRQAHSFRQPSLNLIHTGTSTSCHSKTNEFRPTPNLENTKIDQGKPAGFSIINTEIQEEVKRREKESPEAVNTLTLSPILSHEVNSKDDLSNPNHISEESISQKFTTVRVLQAKNLEIHFPSTFSLDLRAEQSFSSVCKSSQMEEEICSSCSSSSPVEVFMKEEDREFQVKDSGNLFLPSQGRFEPGMDDKSLYSLEFYFKPTLAVPDLSEDGLAFTLKKLPVNNLASEEEQQSSLARTYSSMPSRERICSFASDGKLSDIDHIQRVTRAPTHSLSTHDLALHHAIPASFRDYSTHELSLGATDCYKVQSKYQVLMHEYLGGRDSAGRPDVGDRPQNSI